MPTLLYITIEMDRDKEGYVKIVKGGYYRFTIKIFKEGMDCETESPILTLKGFRVTRGFEVLITPQSVQDHTVYNYILSSPEYSRELMDRIKHLVGEDNARRQAADGGRPLH